MEDDIYEYIRARKHTHVHTKARTLLHNITGLPTDDTFVKSLQVYPDLTGNQLLSIVCIMSNLLRQLKEI